MIAQFLMSLDLFKLIQTSMKLSEFWINESFEKAMAFLHNTGYNGKAGAQSTTSGIQNITSRIVPSSLKNTSSRFNKGNLGASQVNNCHYNYPSILRFYG